MQQAKAPCDVCVLVRGDRTLKRVSYCGMCKAWMCAGCSKRYDLRAIAAIKQKALELISVLKEGA